MEKRYRSYAAFLEDRYGEKVYKLPINLPVTCPHREKKTGKGGCIFCGQMGAGFEMLKANISVIEQMAQNRQYIGEKYHARRFIAYFQNFTNTYMPLDTFKRVLEDACSQDIVGVAISTRPDCIQLEYLEAIQTITGKYKVDPYIELGLQTVNYHTLKKINRGHSLAEFIDGVLQIKRFGFDICAHVILNLPWDTMDDVVENAKILSALKIEQVKLHALYILDNTVMGEMYQNNAIQLISKEEYMERVITFLEYLDPSMVVQRLIGRAPKEGSLFVNWNTSWWKIRDDIEQIMEDIDTRQGARFNYLSGKSWQE